MGLVRKVLFYVINHMKKESDIIRNMRLYVGHGLMDYGLSKLSMMWNSCIMLCWIIKMMVFLS